MAPRANITRLITTSAAMLVTDRGSRILRKNIIAEAPSNLAAYLVRF